MKKFYPLILFMVLFSCKKENEKGCWQVYDMLGNDLGVICLATEAEIKAQYGQFYDRFDAPKFCWKVFYNSGSIGYVDNMSEKMMGIWYSASASSWEKFQCGFCQRWLTREKHVYKPTNQFRYSQVTSVQYCGDTVNTLFPGRSIILRESTDSVIYHEFMQKQ